MSRPWMIKAQQAQAAEKERENKESEKQNANTPNGSTPKVPDKQESGNSGEGQSVSSLKARLNMFENKSENSVPPKAPLKPKPVADTKESTISVKPNSPQNKTGINSSPTDSRVSSGKLVLPSAFSDKTVPTPVPRKPVNKTLDTPNASSVLSSSPTKPSVDKPKPAPKKFGSTSSDGDFQSELQKKLIARTASNPSDDSSSEKPEPPPKDLPKKPSKLNIESVQKLQGLLSPGSAKSPSEKGTDSPEEKVVLRNQPKGVQKDSNLADKWKQKRKSVKRKSYKRNNDGVKFYSFEIQDNNLAQEEADIPPPLGADDIKRLRNIIEQYKIALAELENDSSKDEDLVTEDIDDIYEAIPADEDEFSPRQAMDARAVSMIQPMTEYDEEKFDAGDYEDDDQETYEDTANVMLPPPPEDLLKPPPPEGPPPTVPKRAGAQSNQPTLPSVPKRLGSNTEPPQENNTEEPVTEETYEDCTTEQNAGSGGSYSYSAAGSAGDSGGGYSADGSFSNQEQDEIYEVPEEEVSENDKIPEKKTPEKLSAKDKKRLEEQRKKREKAEKEERKRAEKMYKELKKNFKIEQFELEAAQGEGSLRQDIRKGGKLDFIGHKGHRVTILRMSNNPPGKWLVRSQEDSSINKNTIGYVDSDNIEIMSTSSLLTANDGDVYEDVDGDSAVDTEPPQELYEEV